MVIVAVLSHRTMVRREPCSSTPLPFLLPLPYSSSLLEMSGVINGGDGGDNIHNRFVCQVLAFVKSHTLGGPRANCFVVGNLRDFGEAIKFPLWLSTELTALRVDHRIDSVTLKLWIPYVRLILKEETTNLLLGCVFENSKGRRACYLHEAIVSPVTPVESRIVAMMNE
jgi:hypothetical protein